MIVGFGSGNEGIHVNQSQCSFSGSVSVSVHSFSRKNTVIQYIAKITVEGSKWRKLHKSNKVKLPGEEAQIETVGAYYYELPPPFLISLFLYFWCDSARFIYFAKVFILIPREAFKSDFKNH